MQKQILRRRDVLFVVIAGLLLGACGQSPGKADVDNAGLAVTDDNVGLVAANGGGHHRRCGWLLVTDPVGKASYLANAAWFDVIHPDWYALNADGLTLRSILATDDADVLAASTQNHVAVWPMVASVDDVDYTRTMLYSPANRAAHIQNLVNLAVAHNYAGLDLDYEHLWDPADAAPLAAFITEFGAAMHAAGKSASMAVPGLSGVSSVWSYDVLAANLDEAHIMGYDFHTIGTHAGPTAPLGWIEQVAAMALATGSPRRFILGLPNYGVTPTISCVLSQCSSLCTSSLSLTSDHMLTCPFGAYPAIGERTPNCTAGSETLYYDDVGSLEQKVVSAWLHGLGGVTYWNLGGEPAGMLDMIKVYYR